jgi:hypothetical protein
MMLVNLANLSLLRASARQVSQKLGLFVSSGHQNKQVESMGTHFLGQISFLRETALSQPSQQGKKGQDEGVCMDSSVMMSNRVHRWMVPVKVSSLLDGDIATMAILVWPQILPCLFWGVSIFRVVSHNHQFFF